MVFLYQGAEDNGKANTFIYVGIITPFIFFFLELTPYVIQQYQLESGSHIHILHITAHTSTSSASDP